MAKQKALEWQTGSTETRFQPEALLSASKTYVETDLRALSRMVKASVHPNMGHSDPLLSSMHGLFPMHFALID